MEIAIVNLLRHAAMSGSRRSAASVGRRESSGRLTCPPNVWCPAGRGYVVVATSRWASRDGNAGQVVGVDVVDAGGEQFAPHGVPRRARHVRRGPQPHLLAALVGRADNVLAQLCRSASGKAPTPAQAKLSVQLSLISGMNEAGAALPRSASLPS
ncbi:hypothetical protein SALBM311S_00170 [Streptomyces alboniger]